MTRVAIACVVLLAACGSRSRETIEDRGPGTCDPESDEQDVPVPADKRGACGDGMLGRYAERCIERCSGGCGHNHSCATTCTETTEPCDGDNVGGATCESVKLVGGTLRCDPTCRVFDVTGCTACTATATTQCAEVAVDPTTTRAVVAPRFGRDGAALVVATKAAVAITCLDGALKAGASKPMFEGAVDAFAAIAHAEGWLLAVASGVHLHLVAVDARCVRTRAESYDIATAQQIEIATTRDRTRFGVFVTSKEKPMLVVADRAGREVAGTEPMHSTSGRRIVMVPNLETGYYATSAPPKPVKPGNTRVTLVVVGDVLGDCGERCTVTSYDFSARDTVTSQRGFTGQAPEPFAIFTATNTIRLRTTDSSIIDEVERGKTKSRFEQPRRVDDSAIAAHSAIQGRVAELGHTKAYAAAIVYRPAGAAKVVVSATRTSK